MECHSLLKRCLIQIYVPSGNIVSIGNSIPRNTKNFEKSETIDSLSHEWYSSMIIKEIKILLQNICKNNLLTNTILEVQKEFDIIFIQEPPWSFIQSIPSSLNEEGEKLVGVPNHPNWITFSRNTSSDHDSPRVISYINVRLSQFCFSLWKDIFNHRDISCVSFFNNGSIYFLINVYLDSFQTALKYLNVLVMAGDFNIRDNSWDSSFPHHSIYHDLLTDIADSMSLCIFKSTNQVPTKYSNNQNGLNSVIDLIFL